MIEPMDSAVSEPAELSRRINRLFDVIHKRAGPPLSTVAAAEGITTRGIASISAAVLEELRCGQRTDPSDAELVAIADFFGVAAAYLTDTASANRIDAQLDLLRTLRDIGSPQGIAAVYACTRPPSV